MWNAHSTINDQYRTWLKSVSLEIAESTEFDKLLSQFRKDSRKQRPVERRKAEHSFVKFVKSSQQFYRTFLQRLVSVFHGIKELRAVADRLTLPSV